MLNKNFIVKKTDSIISAIEKIELNFHRTVFVVENKKLIGCVSEGDIMRALINKKKIESSLESIMNKSFLFLEKENIKDSKKIFLSTLSAVIPIVNKNMEIQSVLTLENFLKKWLLSRNKSRVRNIATFPSEKS